MTVDEFRTIETNFNKKQAKFNECAKSLEALPANKQILARMSGGMEQLSDVERRVVEEYDKAMDEFAPATDAYLHALQQPFLTE